jgi:hypothetical protein
VVSSSKTATPSLLPILRSRQQAEILTTLLGDPDAERSVSELARQLEIPYTSVHREIDRAERTGLLVSRYVGHTRLVKANTESPYYSGLAEVLTRSFGVSTVLARELADVSGIESAYVYGSWAAHFVGQVGSRPVGDVDVLVLGDPDRDSLYEAAATLERRLGREVQVTIREKSWLTDGTGSFHDTICSRPMVALAL